MIKITSKQRAYLKSLASNISPVINIGKSVLSPTLIAATLEALEKRELVKVNVLQNCTEDIKEIAQTLSERTNSVLVQVIGKKIVLYKPDMKEPKICLPER